MLGDSTIKRDGKYPVYIRILLWVRKKVAPFYRKSIDFELKQKLENIGDFSIFSNNCLGGVFYHDVGRKFTSPLINTAMDGKDFLKFMSKPKFYLEQKLEFISWPGINYPVARIHDIEIRFVHYKSEEECIEKWKERSKRIVWDNIFVVATNHDGMYMDECMKEFDLLPYNKIMFVSNEYPEYEWAIPVKQFLGRYQCRIMTAFADMQGHRYYETAFDIAEWISNKSKGK